MPYLYKVTLTPIENLDEEGKFGSVTIIAQCDGQKHKCWILTSYELAGALVGFFSESDISAIQENLHSGKYIFLPNNYTATEIAEMGYRMKYETKMSDEITLAMISRQKLSSPKTRQKPPNKQKTKRK